MQKIPKDSSDYKFIESNYKKIIFNITKDKNYDRNKFIGGLPITLEQKDVFTILSKDISGNYRYSITQKVDGTRLLLFSYKGYITFVDRNNDFYKLKNHSREELPNFNVYDKPGPDLLIDGELVAFSKFTNEVIDPTSNPSNIDSFSFMAFDILYGPTSIEFTGPPHNKRLVIGGEGGGVGAMAGPIGGKMWSYRQRYDILYKLLYPFELNGYRPVLSLSFKNCDWFVPEIKPIYLVNVLQTTDKLYPDNSQEEKKSVFSKFLKRDRENFYNSINEHVRIKKIEFKKVKLDGLIFTPFDTEYVISGVWKKFLNIQYKWKPIQEQSIDFAIYKEGSKFLLKVKKGDELIVFTERDKQNNKYIPVKVKLFSKEELKQIKDGTIGEFIYDNISKSFKLKNIRKDKTNPNSLSTANNVMKAIRFPVNLENIKSFFLIDKLNKFGLQKLLKFMTKSQLLRCMINNNKLGLFSEKENSDIQDLINLYKSDNNYEFELRFGTIEPNRFQTNLSFNFYKQFIDILNLKYTNIKSEYNLFVDKIAGEIRTRYMHNYLGNLVSTGSIKKTLLKNVDIDLKQYYNLDIRFATSEEQEVKHLTVTNKDADIIFEKKRYSFNFDIFSIDCTEVKVIYVKDSNKINYIPKYQIEIEVKNNTLDSSIIISKITELLKDILSLVN